jgi:hypothetical protein
MNNSEAPLCGAHRNLDASSGLEDLHGRFNLFQMRSTLLRHVGQQCVLMLTQN